jgi:hypothetical protein
MICCNKEENFKNFMTEANCGSRFKSGVGFPNEAKGNDAQFAEFNWMTSVEEGSNKICSGSLIDKNLVITSAACVDGKNANSLKVRLGSWRTNSQEAKPDTEEVHQVEKIILKSTPVKQLEPNVALLVLKSPANLNMYINTACLPPADQTFVGKTCTVVGWGSGKSASGDLKKSDVNVVSCQGAFGGSKAPEQSICAQLDEKLETGATLNCLVEETDNLYQTVGIALLNPSQLDSTPTVFVNTADFKNWVDEKTVENGGEKESYTFSRLKQRFWWALAGAAGYALGKWFG